MFNCPYCENLTYEWNDSDDLKIKVETMKKVRNHFETYHPELLSAVISKEPIEKTQSNTTTTDERVK